MFKEYGRSLALLTVLLPSAIPVACASSPYQNQSAKSVGESIQFAYTVQGEGGIAVARVITRADSCPAIELDNQPAQPMTVRAQPAAVPVRGSAQKDGKEAVFPVLTCETALPRGIVRARVGRFELPVLHNESMRIVVIGDTGCRMKKSENAWQDCSDPDAWPFAQIARVAASFKPDLVLHVGDYHYRESPCPEGKAGCQGSPWGYGWDAWEADFFKPAAPLLAAAPWIVSRGNHEECARGGQGWFRFLDPRPFETERSCNDPAHDGNADYSEPYAVPLGGDTQVIVFDSAKAGKSPLNAANAKDAEAFANYQAQFKTVGMLAGKPGVLSMFTNHHPILALTPKAGTSVIGGNRALLSVMQAVFASAYYPPGIQVALHGHTHLFEAINFATNHPATFLSGNGGDNLDKSLPDPLPVDSSPAEGAVIDKITHSNGFGFLVLDRQSNGWAFKAYSRNGSLMTTCLLNQGKVNCDRTGYIRY